MAGSISLSLSQQFDSTGAPLNGGLLYFYAAGTTTPQSAYQDYSLTIAWPNPMVLDSAGRIPAFYLADGQIKIRLTDSAGVVQVAADNLLVVGASAGTGTPPTVDATTILDVGDIKVKYGTGSLTGFVRANGRTIGNTGSGGTELANTTTAAALFTYLWTTDANLTVSTGRGGSAAADFAASKTITLPDFRGRVIAGLDDMGSTAAGRLTATYFGTAATVLGAAGGSESKAIVTANLPAYTPAGSIVSTVVDGGNVFYGFTTPGTNVGFGGVATGGTQASAVSELTVSSAFTGSAQGGLSTPVAIPQPTMLATVYLKL